MRDERETVERRSDDLMSEFVLRSYTTSEGREYAVNGIARRLQTIARCIDRIHALIPPETEMVPAADDMADVTIFVQAHVFNVFGLTENLALLWVHEKGVCKPNGGSIGRNLIGLTDKCMDVRASFPADLQAYLGSLDPWFEYLTGYRHSLGHRVPLYVPPYSIDPDDLPLYHDLGRRMQLAARDGDIKGYGRLQSEQISKAFFRPWMKHSLDDPTPPIIFHAQVLADFATVEQLSQNTLKAIDGKPI